MKVLHINTFDAGGGAEDFAMDFLDHNPHARANLLVKKKLTNHPGVKEIPKSWEDGLFSLSDKVLWNLGIKKSTRQALFLNESMHHTFQKLKDHTWYREADIIQLHNIHGGFFDLEALPLIAAEKPMVWSMHDMWAFTGGEAYTFENENYKSGNAVTPYIMNYPLSSPWIDRRKAMLVKKKQIMEKIASRLFVVPGSTWLADCFKSSWVYHPNIHVQVIHESINTSLYQNLHKRNWSVPRILVVNTENPFKGAEIFPSLIPQLKQPFDLHVIGKAFPNAGMAKNLIFHPYLSASALSSLYNEVDILIFPSKAENFSLTVVSAMSCGVCVAGAASGGIPEQLGDGNGLLFETGNASNAASVLNKALSNLEETRHIGQKASETVAVLYHTERMYRAYHLLYEKIMRND